MSGQIEAFVVPQSETQQGGIGILLRGAEVVEDPKDELVPGCLLTRAQALQLAYKLGELCQKLRED